MMSRERKKAAALQEKLQLLRSLTHSHAVIDPSFPLVSQFPSQLCNLHICICLFRLRSSWLCDLHH
uniref:Uncharacterized protein n=1 Tax=Aegilops tauschii subsp. strangulata TaxID=200361 RepID=A0A453I5A4_AEGTS